MAGLKIKNETVYVIYRNSEPYQAKGRKIVYTSKGAANGVITNEIRDEAERRFEKETGKDFFDFSYGEYEKGVEKLEKEIRAEFKVVEYGPKEG